MDIETRLALIRGVAEEIITPEELRSLLEQKAHPVAYDGFEPSGLAHLPFGVYRPLLLKDLLKAGVKFKLFLADWHAALNHKMGGSLEAIRQVGDYFVEVWKAAGVDLEKVQVVWASDLCTRREYWERVIRVAKHTSVLRATRALSIMGRREGELLEVAQYFYPAMQVADIFELGVDITQLGMDQRRANILAREVAEKLGWAKPVVVSHHMLTGLQGQAEPDAAQVYDDNAQVSRQIAGKMSKSRPQSAIFVHDSLQEIEQKLQGAFCPPKQVEGNPILDYAKEIVFRAQKELVLERPAKYGGELAFSSAADLEEAYRKGEVHPLDLKKAVALAVDQRVAPIRAHFEKQKRARELLEQVRSRQVTR